jgi:hypothetical protein
MDSVIIVLNMPLLSGLINILAYIDPGTGSIILQALVASVVGAAIAVKLFWHRILKFLGLRKSSTPESSNKPGDKE